ncbi:hypothetical protein [Nocardioides massiliensis]|uniref:MarR family transcriptional regulator n=1 Tax=Nocardioides massiliensis TaxID=1325935 RepID=A0ABT9NR53_9ACTN|nr:hypothetical protein [Nocardioides massiliensis]MDP9822908.1 hypothetical protein [Nocardioides massiliensis]
MDLEIDDEREPARLTPTGHPEVDAVLDTMIDLPERPVAEHVAVFENAHETLRRTLAGAGQAQEG